MKTKYRLFILVVTLRYTHILQLVKSTKDTVAKPSESVKMLSVTLDSKHVSYITGAPNRGGGWGGLNPP